MNRKAGFSLLEVIIAISILAGGLLAAASMHVSALKVTTRAYRTTEATGRARDRMELLLSLPYDDPLLSAGGHSDPCSPEDHRVTWRVEENGSVSGIKMITVTVSWRERGMTGSSSLRCVKVLPGDGGP